MKAEMKTISILIAVVLLSSCVTHKPSNYEMAGKIYKNYDYHFSLDLSAVYDWEVDYKKISNLPMNKGYSIILSLSKSDSGLIYIAVYEGEERGEVDPRIAMTSLFKNATEQRLKEIKDESEKTPGTYFDYTVYDIYYSEKPIHFVESNTRITNSDNLYIVEHGYIYACGDNSWCTVRIGVTASLTRDNTETLKDFAALHQSISRL